MSRQLQVVMHGEPDYMWSGTRYTIERGEHFPEKHPNAHRRVRSNPPIFSEEELMQVRPITLPNTVGGKENPTASVQSGNSSQNPVSSQGTLMVQQPQQVHRNRMADEIKLPIFRGIGLENPDQHQFLCEADDIKMAQLLTTFRDRALSYLMKYTDGKFQDLKEKHLYMAFRTSSLS